VEIKRLITIRSFEVEEMTTLTDDTVFDMKVLPDRAHDALSHRGMAREIAALFGLETLAKTVPRYLFQGSTLGQKGVRVTVQDPVICPRYIAVTVEGVSVAPSPDGIKKKLEAIGARSINNLVDITNIVLFDLGQPMHAFDAQKVKGGITVRKAHSGETMTTLDGKDLQFDGSEVVIADDEGVLALAGIKGGKKAEVDAQTTSIILESANFHSALTRKTSSKFGIKTDASKRFENGMTSSFAEDGMYEALSLLLAQIPHAKVGVVTDVYGAPESWQYLVGITADEVNTLLGTTMKDKDITAALTRLGFSYQTFIPETALQLRLREVLGKEYKNPSSMRVDAPHAFSCSSLVSYLFTHAGVWMPSITVDKYVYARPVTKDELCFGDLIFSNTGDGKIHYETVEFMPGTPVPEGVDHVGMYLGDGEVLHASRAHGKVVREDLAKSKQFSHIVGYRRVLEDVPVERHVVEIPKERLDLRLPVDVIEEIGRHVGYNVISPTLPRLTEKGMVHPRLLYGQRIRTFFLERGFSEIITYSFAKQGEGTIEVLNPVGKDRPYLRSNLFAGMEQALKQNDYYAPLIGLSDVQVFEIGTVFRDDGEKVHLAIGIYTGSKQRVKGIDEEMNTLLLDLSKYLGVSIPSASERGTITQDKKKGVILELNLDAFTSSLSGKDPFEVLPSPLGGKSYQTLSAFPFIVRDIAFFVPELTQEAEIDEVLRAAGGPLVVRFSRFDRFQKPGESQVSYAYRFVFQAFDRTLTDDEVNKEMERVYAACAGKGWQTR
jgi:phenylalanyl-tRNA synthetase beta subunit